MVGSGKGARNGIMFKTAVSLEEAGKVSIVALDKTGTITEGKPKVTDIIAIDTDEMQLLKMAYSLESKSEHPLAKAIVEYAKTKGIEALIARGADWDKRDQHGETPREYAKRIGFSLVRQRG